MWQGRAVSLVFPTYREKNSLYDQVLQAALTNLIDEIIVVNNNAEAGTSEEIQRACGRIAADRLPVMVREVFEPAQGYGAACLRGLEEATGFYRCLSEPDGTFIQDDILKLLAYTDRCDFVIGSRTVRTFIWSRANMWWFLRFGNWAVAKLMEFLFNTTCLSDVGCTMRAITAPAFHHMRPYLTVRGNYFGPQMMIVAHLLDLPVVQIPINYRERVGISSVTGDFGKAVALGFQMIWLILQYRLHGLGRPRPAYALPGLQNLSRALDEPDATRPAVRTNEAPPILSR